MRRLLVVILCGTSLMLCVSTVALWMRSYFAIDGFEFSRSTVERDQMIDAASSRGEFRIQLQFFHCVAPQQLAMRGNVAHRSFEWTHDSPAVVLRRPVGPSVMQRLGFVLDVRSRGLRRSLPPPTESWSS